MRPMSRLYAGAASLSLLVACAVQPAGRVEAPVEVAPAALPGQASTPSSLVGDPQSLSGRVRFGGLDPSGLVVTAYLAEAPKGAPSSSTLTDAEGRFRLPVPAGRYNVVVRQPGTNLAAVRFAVQAGVVLDIDLTPTGTLVGRVTGPVGANLVGTDVFVPGSDIQGKTDADGQFVLRNVPVGTYTVGTIRPGYGYAAIEGVEVKAAETATVEGLAIRRDIKVGRIVGNLAETRGVTRSGGAPLPDPRMCNVNESSLGDWTDVASPSPDFTQLQVTVIGTDGSTTSARIDGAGQFVAEDVAAGPVLLVAKGPGRLDTLLGQTVFPDATIRPEIQTAPAGISLGSPRGPLEIGAPYKLGFAKYRRFVVDRYEPEFEWIWTSSDSSIATVSHGVVTGLATGSVEIGVRDPQDDRRSATASVQIDGVPFYATDAVQVRLGGKAVGGARVTAYQGINYYSWMWRQEVESGSNLLGFLGFKPCDWYTPHPIWRDVIGYRYDDPDVGSLPAVGKGLQTLVVIADRGTRNVIADLDWVTGAPQASSSLDVAAPVAFQFAAHAAHAQAAYSLELFDAKRQRLAPTFSKTSDAAPGTLQPLAADLSHLPVGNYFYSWIVAENGMGFPSPLLQAKLVPFSVASGSVNLFGTLDPYGEAGSAGLAEVLPPADDGHLGRLYLPAPDGKTSLGYPSSRTYKVRVPLRDGSSSELAYWRSSDPSVATVDQTGKVTAKSRGRAVIFAVPRDYLRNAEAFGAFSAPPSEWGNWGSGAFEIEVKAVTDVSVVVE